VESRLAALDRGHEHFGFKDGISQPFIDGLTAAPNRKGSDVIAPGEVLIGYPDVDGNISGKPTPLPTPGQPGYNPTPPPPPAALPDWADNGTFLVYRRLQQNVGGFQQFLQSQSGPLSLPDEAVGAKLVGRWASGAPLERVPGEHTDRDPAAGDPAATHPELLSPAKINAFTYQQQDADGHLVPRAAHIRKTNPRDENPPDPGVVAHHRILRRGIPYGEDFTAGEPDYPASGPVPAGQDRGLLFICYQASIDDGFEFVQQPWANTATFPQDGDGQDPIISQNSDPRTATIPPHGPVSMPQWVTTTGGDYFFSPSLAALGTLADG
jgi:Dyp-type peroxidase family